jgi:hypothetical protein
MLGILVRNVPDHHCCPTVLFSLGKKTIHGRDLSRILVRSQLGASFGQSKGFPRILISVDYVSTFG